MDHAQPATFGATVQPETAAPTRYSFAVVAGGGAIIGATVGVIIAILLAAGHGPAVLIANAADIAAGGALLGGLIGANLAGTD